MDAFCKINLLGLCDARSCIHRRLTSPSALLLIIQSCESCEFPRFLAYLSTRFQRNILILAKSKKGEICHYQKLMTLKFDCTAGIETQNSRDQLKFFSSDFPTPKNRVKVHNSYLFLTHVFSSLMAFTLFVQVQQLFIFVPSFTVKSLMTTRLRKVDAWIRSSLTIGCMCLIVDGIRICEKCM